MQAACVLLCGGFSEKGTVASGAQLSVCDGIYTPCSGVQLLLKQQQPDIHISVLLRK